MKKFQSNINSFCKLLDTATITEISSKAYPVSYLQNLILHKKHYLEIYCTVLEKAFDEKDIKDAVLLDFGTGNGLLALFAKFCGVKTVFASDVSSDFLDAAKALSKQLDIEIDGWILGNEDILVDCFTNTKIDVVVGTDVIEHIYNLNKFYTILKGLNSEMMTVFTTASVAENPFKSARLKKLQLKDELEDSNAFQASYKNDYSGLSFWEIRKKIIQHSYPSLTEKELITLVKLTRGMIKVDIEKSVNQYIQHRILPQALEHPTNTCDPITGSWTERLLSIEEYRQVCAENDFCFAVFNGFYNDTEGGIKALMASILNKLILVIGKRAIHISPFIIIKGY